MEGIVKWKGLEVTDYCIIIIFDTLLLVNPRVELDEIVSVIIHCMLS